MHARCLIQAVSIVFLFSTAAHGQSPLVGCKEFGAMTESQQLIYIQGIEEGLGIVVGLADVSARDFAQDAKTDGEKVILQKMAAGLKAYLNRPEAPRGEAMIKAIRDKCLVHDSAGVAYLDVLTGLK